MIIGRKIFIHFLSKGYDVDDDDWRAMAFARISFTPNPNKINVLTISTQLLNNQKNKDKYKQFLSNILDIKAYL